jgi:spore coat polysaccharide biosynthesis protein SpsF
MYKTKQEAFWAGDFGNKYLERNTGDEKVIASRIYLFSKILSKTSNVHSIFELGANIGHNLIAISKLLPDVFLSAIEINQLAVEKLKQIDKVSEVISESILEFDTKKTYDFVFTRGVLIHINPNKLNEVYKLLYNCSKKYICIIEYYNPTPLEIKYRGHRKVLFKRDFTGEIIDKFPDVQLIDYGFIYRRDPNFPQDDITWFLLKK